MSLLIGTKRALLRKGLNWLLRDEFLDTRAAGAVNGTLATPGLGTRTVTDTGGDEVSVGNGALLFSNPNAAFDCGCWYGAVTRTIGRVFMLRVSLAANNTQYEWGLDRTPPGRIGTGGVLVFAQAGNISLLVADGATYVTAADAYAANTNYYTAIVQSDPGDKFFIKGGAFENWTLLWADTTSSFATLYPAITNFSSIATTDFIRSPVSLYLPPPLAYDTFTRANGALGSTESTGQDGQPAPPQTWNNRVGTTQVATNKASASALTGGIAIATVDTAASVDGIVKATLTRAGNEVGLVLRYVDADNYIRAVHDGINCQLIKRVATVETTVITAVVAIGAGEIVIICQGTSFSLYLNNAQVGATSAIADAAMQTGTEQGLFSTNVGNTQDAFLVMPRGTDGEYNTLDLFSGESLLK